MSGATTYHVTVAGRTHVVEVGPAGVAIDGAPVAAELRSLAGGPIRSLLLDAASHRIVAHREGKGRWDLRLDGERISVEVYDERTRRIRELAGSGAAATGPRPVRAPMPGLVVRVEVAEGDEIRPGQGLLIVEAMKMENELRAEAAARVRRIHVAAGEAVAKDQLLIELDALGEGGG